MDSGNSEENHMHRKTYINQLQRAKETGTDVRSVVQRADLGPAEQEMQTPSTSGAALASRRDQSSRNAVNEETVRGTIHTVEEIASMLMQVADKKERCPDFDLHYWLTRYTQVRKEVNFPVEGMLVDCSAQIYGRKVDYLTDIVIHMDSSQKTREKQQATEANESPATEEDKNAKPGVRKRAGRFNPQSVSDCFSDLEFSFSHKKLLKLDDLITPPTTVQVDRRTKFQQMQELCKELRMHPTRQRRQEILNRLRDEACIQPMMSSHGMARKNQILDLETAEPIGTRYDYQIHHNYIDGRTGSLRAEHDLKRFFQRCDVMDFMYEQLETERARCSRLGMPEPADVLSTKARELKIFMPPEYLKDRYRISVNDTTDFENALIQARITNYNSDPILSLMDAAERERHCRKIAQGNPAAGDLLETYDSGFINDSTMFDEPSFKNVLCSSRLNETSEGATGLHNSTQDSTQPSMQPSNENPLESELVQLESGNGSQIKIEGDKLTGIATRLSVDEGIGVDCESPPRSSSTTQEVNSKVLFTGGNIIPRQPVSRPVHKLLINLFGIPANLTQKNSTFSLPVEYRKLKMNLLQRKGPDPTRVTLYSLHPSAVRNPLWVERPTTPELEDFAGFDDEEAPGECNLAIKNATESSVKKEQTGARSKRPSTPECDFAGFTDEEITIGYKSIPVSQLPVPKGVAILSSPARSAKNQPTGDGSSSTQVTPSRTLSCDSGISDSAERSKESGSSPELMSDQDEGFDGRSPDPANIRQPLKEHTDASNALIQQRIDEAKERIVKVNEWHKKLKPILVESEKRNHFDIHEYGTEIINTFDAVAQHSGREASDDLRQHPTITLATILQNKPVHSTARYFLSMLMLANTNNVAIVNKNRDPLRLSTTEEIELQLISRKRHHQEMEALGDLLPTCSDAAPGPSKRHHRKRKLMVDDLDTVEATPCQKQYAARVPTVSAEQFLAAAEEPNFIDNVQRLYPELNSEESKRKRMAFRRGMRNHAYGLVEENEESATTEERQANERPPSTSPADPRHIVPPLHSIEEDDILQVDLLTNHAMLIPTARDPDDGCAKSVFSMAESGYESMVSDGNISR